MTQQNKECIIYVTGDGGEIKVTSIDGGELFFEGDF